MNTTCKLLLLIVCALAIVACGETELPASKLEPFGRTLSTESGVELIGSASHVGFTFKGTSCKLYASISDWQDHNYLQYELDGMYVGRVRINQADSLPLTIAANENGRHSVWLYKATEAHTGPVFIHKVLGEGVAPLVWEPKPLIEFIGNSITCGAAADPSDVPCGEGVYHDQHNAYMAYGPRVARALGANYFLSSVSGIGIYRNWNSDGPTMPQVYDKADFQLESDRLWDFKRYSPDVVSIALGTNDFSNGDGIRDRLPFDSASFVSGYILFVNEIKLKYPAAQIALLSSPMVQGENRILLENCLHAVKQAIDNSYPDSKPVALHLFKSMQAKGCTGHPDVEDHAMLAEELVPFFRPLMVTQE